MSVVDDIKERLDIVEVISGYVGLKKAGRSFKAVCPFHTEKTPSFVVNPERQSWRCFGACATGGDVFSFVMRQEGLDFGGALRLLAQKAGVELSPKRDTDRYEGLYQINQATADFYREVLDSKEGLQARSYLDERGVNSEASSKFELGLSPGSWDGLKTHLLSKGYPEEVAVEAGLLRCNEEGGTRDFFKGRLMFPIHDRRGRIGGFGARALDDSMPKYLNTAATPIFDKRGTLYGYHLASGAIRDKNSGIIVEGYMDVIAAHQFDYTNVVASMGTAVTGEQVSQLKSLARNFVLALDPDAAGQEATLRSLESSWRMLGQDAASGRRSSLGVLYQREPLTLRIAALPEGRDPDALIREDAAEWERLTEEAVPLMDFLIPALASRFDLTTVEGKSQVVEALSRMISETDPLEQDHYMQMLARTLGVTNEALKASLSRIRDSQAAGRRPHRRQPEPEVSASALASSTEDIVEDYTLALLLSKPELKEQVREFNPENFHKSEYREVFTRWLSCTTIGDLRESLNESLQGHVDYLAEKVLAPADRKESETGLAQCLRRLERRHLQELQESLLASEDPSLPPPRDMEVAIANVNARIRELSI
jgi:DNA primase